MKNVLEQIFSLVLPVIVVVLVPLWIESKRTVHAGISLFFGLLLIVFGLVVMVLTISSFIRIGKGTLAPWSPTKRLVIQGLYHYVRNPMIIGVLTILLGEALSVLSQKILIWAGAFFLVNTVYFMIYEEPNLEQRFGNDYRDYKKHVHRWLPRLKPYRKNQKQN